MDFAPTPIQFLWEDEQGNRVYVKREDLLPYSFGGNKARIGLEYLADMERQGKDHLIAYGNARSNLCRVLSNLIDNARDAILETGSPSEHSIRVALGETPGAFTFCVSNDGPPIPPKHLGSIFQMGFTTKADGHGSGLSIVSELMRGFGGHIDVQSDEKQTRFTGTLPKQSAP